MKFVYVVTCDAQSYYAEQAYVSMYSLRKHNPGCHIVFATEAETLKTFTGNRARILELVDELITVDVPDEFSMVQRSRYIKTSIRQRVEGDFLYIDCDTVIMGSLADLDSVEDDVCAIRIQDSYDWSEENSHYWLEIYNSKKGVPLGENYGVSEYYNGGVILAKDTEKARAFYDTWHKLWLEDSTKYKFNLDQCSLWRANRLNNNVIKEISGIYNCQIVCPIIALRYVYDCKVFHYHSNSIELKQFRLKNPELLKRMLDPENESELNDLIATARREYLIGLKVFVSPDLYKWMDSPLVGVARVISGKLPIIDKLLTKLYRVYARVIDKRPKLER